MLTLGFSCRLHMLRVVFALTKMKSKLSHNEHSYFPTLTINIHHDGVNPL
jgi:hypothetical protein